jgi:hypothetical protein
MDVLMTIPVTYLGKELEFEAKFYPYGFIYRIELNLDGITVFFEPDEERNYRAIIAPEHLKKIHKLDTGLLAAIASQLNAASNT